MKIPKGHVSPSQIDTWDRCEMQWAIFSGEILGFSPQRPPEFFWEVKKQTHDTLLEHDLRYKMETGHNRGDSELMEHFRNAMEQKLPLIKEDPNLEGKAEDEIGKEIGYFDQIVKAKTVSEFRHNVTPLAVEKKLEGEVSGIPVVGYLDFVADRTIFEEINDLKRYDKSPREGLAKDSRQLATYSILTGIRDVAMPVIVENKSPVLKVDTGQITEAQVARVKRQYEVIGERMEHALEKGSFLPVNKGDRNKGWVCSAKWCGAWRKDATDWITSKPIACPWGERGVESNA